MKLLLLILLAPALCFAQKKTYSLLDTPVRIDSSTGAMTYTEVVAVDGATTEQLYSRAKQFLPRIFVSDGNVIQTDDKASGVLAGRGRFISKTSVGASLMTGVQQLVYEMAIDLRVKDGRYRYEFSNIQVSYPGTIVRVDDTFRRNPKAAKRYANQQFNEKQYAYFMGDKDPMNVLIRQLKEGMKSVDKKSDF